MLASPIIPKPTAGEEQETPSLATHYSLGGCGFSGVDRYSPGARRIAQQYPPQKKNVTSTKVRIETKVVLPDDSTELRVPAQSTGEPPTKRHRNLPAEEVPQEGSPNHLLWARVIRKRKDPSGGEFDFSLIQVLIPTSANLITTTVLACKRAFGIISCFTLYPARGFGS